MQVGFLSSNSSFMMEKSMDFLWAKQAAILDNIANAETPNYKAKVVTFEENLRQQLEAAQVGSQSATRRQIRQALEKSDYQVEEQQEVTRMDDNGVNVTEQSTEMLRNSYQLQYVMGAINSDLSRLRTAIRGQ